MGQESFFVRFALPLFVVFLAAGCYGLAVAHGRMEGPNFKGLVHVSAALVLLSGIALMFRAESRK
jgi:uncharacterized membrane protein SirB2